VEYAAMLGFWAILHVHISISILIWGGATAVTKGHTLEDLAGGLHFTFQFHQWQVINFPWVRSVTGEKGVASGNMPGHGRSQVFM
jgi:hypothetical protein